LLQYKSDLLRLKNYSDEYMVFIKHTRGYEKTKIIIKEPIPMVTDDIVIVDDNSDNSELEPVRPEQLNTKLNVLLKTV